MPRLLVLACSARKHRIPHPVPAWYRYDGVLYRLCKSLEAHHRFPPDVHVRIISAEHGLLTPETPIAWYDRRLDPARAAEIRRSVTRALCRAVEEHRVSEVYLALGRRYRSVVGALPPHAQVRGTPAGIGTMQSRLRRWLAAASSAAPQLSLELPGMHPPPPPNGPAAHPRVS
jgi:hypothetical protein